MAKNKPRMLVDPETGEMAEAKDTSRARENKDFVMMFRQFISQVADLAMADPQALRVLLFICKHMDNKNALAITMDLMASMIGLTRQTISSKIKYLRETGWLAVYKLGKQNIYIVNPDVFWTSYGDQRAYCKFESNIMLSYEDNWRLLKDQKTTVRHIHTDLLQKFADQLESQKTKPANKQIDGQMSIEDINFEP